jgi:ornithine carbamoyltransferase
VLERARQAGAKIACTADPLEAARGAHVLNTDVWASMGMEAEQKEREKAFVGFQINSETLRVADPGCIVLHCLPAHRGEEITEEVIEGPHSAVFDEAENRLHVQKAIMATLMG